MLLMLLFLGSGPVSTAPVIDTHDGWAIHERAKKRESKLSKLKRTDAASEIAAEMREALKVPSPQPKIATTVAVPGFDDDEEAILCLI